MGRSAAISRKCTLDILKGFWNNYDTFIFDADGVLWTGDIPIEGAPELLKKLMESGKNVIVVSNNATKKPDKYVEKFQKLGFEDEITLGAGITVENIISSAMVCVHELKKMKEDPNNAERRHLPVYLLGSLALKEMLSEVGIECIGFGHDRHSEEELTNFPEVGKLPEVFAVVSSYDRHLNLDKLSKAGNYLAKNHSVHFIATNEDLTFPKNKNEITLGAGVVSQNLRMLSGRIPIVMGKPSKLMWKFMQTRYGGKLNPKRALMIGDRCDTDILFGNNSDLDTLLVLSGITDLSTLENFEQQKKDELLPTFYTDSVRDLLID